jgi:outer membrane protein assembly factor BamB
VYAVDPNNPDETITKLDRVPMNSITNVAKAIYPSHRWRDNHDFEQAVQFVPEKCFVAPDGVTIIPEQYDFARSTSSIEAVPGKLIYNSDEFFKRVVIAQVSSNGTLTNLKHFVEQAEFGTAVDANGNVYIADGHIYVYDKEGTLKNEIRVPERPSSITFGGANNDILFITARSGFYAVKI